VTLAVPRVSWDLEDVEGLPYRIDQFTLKDVPRLLFSHDLVICNDYPAVAMLAFPFKTFVLDYYTIYYLEWMEIIRDEPGITRKAIAKAMSGRIKRVAAQLLFADFLTCANDRQKDYYVGAFIALGLISPPAYDFDPGLHRLMQPAPHGIRPDPLPERALEPRKRVLKGVYAGIRGTDKLIIWNGGILQWYDSLSLIRAVAQLKQKRDDIKLVFVGGGYPGLGSMGLGMRFQETVELSKELGLYNNTVWFDQSWVPYDRIKDYMLEADLAVCTYFDNLETHFSFRTRFVDVFWAELPLICTHGDVLADLVAERGLGVVVPQQDVGAIADAIEKLCDDSDFYEQTRRNIRETNKELGWGVALKELVEFCRDPQSSAVPKWRRTALLAGAWTQWAFSRASGMLLRR
jgi:glycosyltransferase involved in cell wall biosynthesis